jgi:hypothetical protein
MAHIDKAELISFDEVKQALQRALMDTKKIENLPDLPSKIEVAIVAQSAFVRRSTMAMPRTASGARPPTCWTILLMASAMRIPGPAWAQKRERSAQIAQPYRPHRLMWRSRKSARQQPHAEQEENDRSGNASRHRQTLGCRHALFGQRWQIRAANTSGTTSARQGSSE